MRRCAATLLKLRHLAYFKLHLVRFSPAAVGRFKEGLKTFPLVLEYAFSVFSLRNVVNAAVVSEDWRIYLLSLVCAIPTRQ